MVTLDCILLHCCTVAGFMSLCGPMHVMVSQGNVFVGLLGTFQLSHEILGTFQLSHEIQRFAYREECLTIWIHCTEVLSVDPP